MDLQVALILTGRGPPVFRLRAGHDRRALLDGDGAAQPQEGDHRRHPALRPRSNLRLPPHAPRPLAGMKPSIGVPLSDYQANLALLFDQLFVLHSEISKSS